MTGVLIGDAKDIGGHEPGGDLIEFREDVPLIRHQQDRPDVGDVADRAGLIHEPAIQLVAIEPHHFIDGRVEEKPRLILHVHLQAELFRALQRGKAFEEMVFVEGHYLLALDGTGYFSSQQIHCESC